jgi:hypothetical protein
MKRNPEFAILALWAIAIVATALLAGSPNAFTLLGPVYFVCMAGSLVTVRKARQLGR